MVPWVHVVVFVVVDVRLGTLRMMVVVRSYCSSLE